MSLPTKENTGLELRKDAKGNLHLWHRGERILTTQITFQNGSPSERARVTVEMLAQYIQVVDEH